MKSSENEVSGCEKEIFDHINDKFLKLEDNKYIIRIS